MTKIDVRPNSKPQEDFFGSSADECLFGGSSGGGKTWSIVVDPLRYCGYKDFTGIIFRRTYPELQGSVFPLTQEYYLAAGATWNEQKKTYTFPSGAIIRLGYMESAEDWRNYQGHEYAYQGYDELTNFLEPHFTMLGAWNRSKAIGIPAYRRAASNPGGQGHIWVKRYFIDKSPAKIVEGKKFSELAQIYWQPVEAGDIFTDKVSGLTRQYVPSRVFDNTTLLERNPNYIKRLLALPERQRKALLEGDWNAFEGQFFSFDTSSQLVSPFEIPKEWRLIGGLDPGYSSPCSFSISAMDFSENIYRVAGYYERNRSPLDHARGISEFIKTLKLTGGRMPDVIVADPSAWAKKDKYAIDAHERTFVDVMNDSGIFPMKAVNDRIQGWWALKDMMSRRDKKTIGTNGSTKIIETPKYYVFDIYNNPFVEELSAAIADDKNPEDIQGKGNDPAVSDHALDEERYKIMAIYKPRKEEIDARPEWRKKLDKKKEVKKSIMAA